MQLSGFVLSLCACLLSSRVVDAQFVATFDSAVASSAIPSGAYPAVAATLADAGYWCSSGNHAPGERVTWTGIVNAKQSALAVSINWAYSPGEFSILTSSDGGNFEEATGWRTATRSEMSYTETVLFAEPRAVKAVAIVMRSAKPWGFFGINDVSLSVLPGPGMLVSRAGADASELCLIAHGSEVGMRGCLGAVASGIGQEVFKLSQSSQLVSVASGECVSLAGEGVRMQDCEQAADAGDRRSFFTLTPSLQLQASNGYCLSATATRVSVAHCSAPGSFIMAAAPELNPGLAAHLLDVSTLLQAAEARQLAFLHELTSGLNSCRGLVQRNVSKLHHIALISSLGMPTAIQDPAVEAGSKIDGEAGVDLIAIKALIAESKDALAAASF